MPSFASISKGIRARKRVELSLWSGEVVPVDLRPLLGDEEADVLGSAVAFAKARGVDDPKPGDELFELGRMTHTLVLACLDVESAVDAPKPFFESAAQVLKHLDRDRIAFLFERQACWQDECAPGTMQLLGGDFIAKVMEVASSEDDRPFVALRPSMRASFTRSIAKLLLISQALKSDSGSSSATSSTNAS